MSELALRTETAVAVGNPTGGRLVAWAEAARAANQLAKVLSRTSFVPAAFKGNEYDATAAILMGDELGLSPLAALRSIYVIHGTPAMYARTMVALALSHGHQVWTEKSTDNEVVVCGQRKGSQHVERSMWTTARATKAGYAGNKKYSTNGAEMLYAKAAAEVARKIAPDVLAGIGASVEDIELGEPEPTTTVTRQPAATKTVRRHQPEPIPEPALDEIPEPDVESGSTPEPMNVTSAVELINQKQLTLLHTLFTEKGLQARDERLAYVNGLGFDVTSSKDLTKAAASRVIDALQGEDDPS